MDQRIEEITRPVEEVPKEPPKKAPSERLKEAPKETSSEASIPVADMQVKTEPGDQATSPAKFPHLEVSITSVKPNEQLRKVLLGLNKVHNNEDPEPNELPNNPEQESLDQTDSEESSDNDQASDEDYESSSDDESDADEEEPSSDDGSVFDPKESSTKPTKKRPSKERQKKARNPLTMNEQVKSLMSSDILSAANANAIDMYQIPVSQKKDKSKALAEEVSKLSIEDQPQAKKDANALIEYSKRFTPSAKIVDMNWQVGGLNTLLKHHQVRISIKPNL